MVKKDVKKQGINNIEFNKEGNFIIASLNPKIYPLEVIYSAVYVFLDKAYVIIDGDPDNEIFVQLKAKNSKEDMEKLGMEFNNELVNYAVYVVQAIRNQPLRKAVIERALLTNTSGNEYCTDCGCKLEYCKDCDVTYCPSCSLDHENETAHEMKEEDYIVDDPLNIAKPWTPPKEAGDEKPKNKKK